MYSLILYRVLTNAYARFVRVADGAVWSDTAQALSLTTAWSASDVALTRDGTYIGGTPVTIPPALPAGDYDMLFYENATPAAADAVLIGKRIMWSGNNLIGLPIDL